MSGISLASQDFGGALISGQKRGDAEARWNHTNPQVQPGQARGGGGGGGPVPAAPRRRGKRRQK